MLKLIVRQTVPKQFGFRASSSFTDAKNINAKQLLENAATFNDAKPSTPDDKWSTLPYPQGVVIPKRQQPTDESQQLKMDPENTSIILFSGEGSQYGGMAKSLVDCPDAMDIFERANEILQYDLLKLCLEGPQLKLDQTTYAQPAVFTTSLARIAQLKEERPLAIENCVGAAGYSLGEITALVFAGALPFDQALQLVQIRGEAMQMAYERYDGGTAIVKTGPAAKLQTAIAHAKEYCKNEKGIEQPECTIASYLYPSYKIISGHTEALNYLKNNCNKYGLIKVKKQRLPGAWHSNLLTSVVEPFTEALRTINVEDPIIAVHSNIDGKRYFNAEHVLKNLPRQVISPIRWEQTMHVIYSRTAERYPRTFDIGPGTELRHLLKRNNAKAWSSAIYLKPL